jgi:carboxymethylenebutenolidase
MREQDVRVPVGKRALDCYLAYPEAAQGKRPAVVVIHEIFGLDGHIRDVARRFAKEGYVAAAPNLFSGEIQQVLTPSNIALAMQSLAQVPPDLRRDPSKFAAFAAEQPPERRPLLQMFGRVSSPLQQEEFAKELAEVTRYLRSLPEVDPRRVGSVGFCFGGAMSARLATADPELRAAVIFYGQNPPLEDVPRIQAHVLGLYGGEDHGITDTIPLLEETMRKAGKSYAYHVYPGARHAFFNDTRPQVYHKPSAEDAWKRVNQFFQTELKG